jgi:Relaxase/Mobilisation nuclease domain
MAIGKITRGNGFYGVMSYLLDNDKNPKILGGCMVGEKPDNIAREFRQIANRRPDIQNPVRHLSISFAPEDGEVDDLVKETIAYRVLDRLGYEDCQFIAVGHRRDQKEHDEVHNHDHMHIVTNAVTLERKYINGRFDRYEIQKVLREVEQEFGLKQIKSSWEVKNERGKNQEVATESKIGRLVADSLKNNPSLGVWLDRLAIEGIDVRFNLSDKKTVKGITFIKDGEAHKGSSIGAKWSRYKGTKKPSNLDGDCLVVSEIIATASAVASEDIPIMEAANLKSQQHPVKLNEIERAMFDRSAEMAEMTLLNKGRNGKWRNGRAEIVLNGNNLKVRRVRPEKLMFEAARVDGEWIPVGFPNIEKMDVQLLERINVVEGMDFKTSEQKTLATRGEDPIAPFNIEKPGDFQDDELDLMPIGTTLKEQVQDAIDFSAEQATSEGKEYIEYLMQKGVKVELILEDDRAIGINYQLKGVSFKDTELVNASLSLLKSTRGITFERGLQTIDIEFNEDRSDNEDVNLVNLSLTNLNKGKQIITTKAMNYDEDEIDFVSEEEYSP